MKQLILLSYMLLTIIGCEDNPTDAKKSENHSPTILSLLVFPDIVGSQDSVIVICNAFDPDGDTLVYDWISDAKLRIKGVNPPTDMSLYNTFENSRIFYPTQRAIDTVWVQCFARDRKGKSDDKLVLFIVRKDSL